MISGSATPQGTHAYKERFKNLADGHFRQRNGLWFSSIGIGSYLGDPDDATDQMYEEALKEAVKSGINVVDSAVNYRCQQSERAFGRALKNLIEAGEIKREEVIVCTKGGFLPFDGNFPKDPMEYFRETYIKPGLVSAEDIAQGCHAMTPKYLEDQLQKSLRNLGVETLDIYYLHNPETQLADVDRAEFLDRLRAAFKWAEAKVAEGKIRVYGLATWNGFRLDPESPDYLSLEEINVVAREIGGPNHHFKVVQLPLNLAMPEAWAAANQSFGANLVPFLNVASHTGITVIGSASLLQSRLTGALPEFLHKHFPGLEKNSQRALQFARSVPGLTTSLVGMKKKVHIAENIETAKVPPLSEQQLILMFQQNEP